MSVDVDVRDEAASFVDKWRARWPEWELGMVFVPAAQKPRAEAWLSLLQELGDAAWGGTDPTPGLAKLAWWQEELIGWSKGARRHPLGAVLQPLAAPWQALGRTLPDLRALRDDEGVGEIAGLGAAAADQDQQAAFPTPGRSTEAGSAFAAAVADCEAALFEGCFDAAATQSVLRSLLGERGLLRGASDDAIAAIAAVDRSSPGARPGCRVRGVQEAFVTARLAHPGAAPHPLRALFAAWRGARRAG